jgi:hypothetical protein
LSLDQVDLTETIRCDFDQQKGEAGMKLWWITGILVAGALAIPGVAQVEHKQSPNRVLTTDASDDSLGNSGPPLDPQGTLNTYEEQMALVTLQTCAELTEIAQAVRAGQIKGEQAEYLTRHSYELGVVRIQFLDTLHQILETNLSKQVELVKPAVETAKVQTSEATLIVVPPTSSSDIPEAIAAYLELTPVQIAAIQARVSEEQKYIQPLLEQLAQNRKALTMATEAKPSNDSKIRKLASEQSHILERLIIANSRLQRDISEALTVEQHKKLGGPGQDIANLTERLFAQR